MEVIQRACINDFFYILDTSVAELIKEATDADEFMDCLRCQQGMWERSS